MKKGKDISVLVRTAEDEIEVHSFGIWSFVGLVFILFAVAAGVTLEVRQPLQKFFAILENADESGQSHPSAGEAVRMSPPATHGDLSPEVTEAKDARLAAVVPTASVSEAHANKQVEPIVRVSISSHDPVSGRIAVRLQNRKNAVERFGTLRFLSPSEAKKDACGIREMLKSRNRLSFSLMHFLNKTYQGNQLRSTDFALLLNEGSGVFLGTPNRAGSIDWRSIQVEDSSC